MVQIVPGTHSNATETQQYLFEDMPIWAMPCGWRQYQDGDKRYRNSWQNPPSIIRVNFNPSKARTLTDEQLITNAMHQILHAILPVQRQGQLSNRGNGFVGAFDSTARGESIKYLKTSSRLLRTPKYLPCEANQATNNQQTDWSRASNQPPVWLIESTQPADWLRASNQPAVWLLEGNESSWLAACKQPSSNQQTDWLLASNQPADWLLASNQ